MNSKQSFTISQLTSCYDIYEVTEDEVIRLVGDKEVRIKPSLAIQYDKQGNIRYITQMIHINKTHGIHLNMSMHKLLYIWYHGCVPAGYSVDHIDGNPLNNSIGNLQLLDDRENCQKKRAMRLPTPEEIKGKSIREIRELIDSYPKDVDVTKRQRHYEGVIHTKEFYEKQVQNLYNILEEVKNNSKYKYEKSRLKKLEKLRDQILELEEIIKTF